jgi:hypothetical protein
LKEIVKKCANPKCYNIIPHFTDERLNKRTFCSKRCKNRVCALANYHKHKAEMLQAGPSDKALEVKLIEYFKENGWD